MRAPVRLSTCYPRDLSAIRPFRLRRPGVKRCVSRTVARLRAGQVEPRARAFCNRQCTCFQAFRPGPGSSSSLMQAHNQPRSQKPPAPKLSGSFQCCEPSATSREPTTTQTRRLSTKRLSTKRPTCPCDKQHCPCLHGVASIYQPLLRPLHTQLTPSWRLLPLGAAIQLPNHLHAPPCHGGASPHHDATPAGKPMTRSISPRMPAWLPLA